MSLTSYQAAPPRVLDSYYGAPEMERKRKISFAGFLTERRGKRALAAQSCVGKIYARQSAGETIQSSSVVERSAVNRLVVGSNPTSGANF